MCVTVNAHVYTNIVEANGRRWLPCLIILHLYFWRQGLLLNLELINLDRIAGIGSGIYLSFWSQS